MEKINVSFEKNVKVVGVSNPGTILTIAKDRNLDPQEVFVRIVIEDEKGNRAKVSQKLRILGRSGYEKLVKAYNDKNFINLTITDSGYVYTTEKASIDDLFSNSTRESSVEERINLNEKDLSKLLGI